MQSADKQLLSLLQKSANPLQAANLSITVKGVYAPPQQWKITDEANPNVFTYEVQILERKIQGGKIQPRKLTEKQLREQQQKNKKGGKKQSKTQQKAPQQNVDPEEQERLRLQWQALTEQERFYRTQQDPYKAFSLIFQNNHQEFELDQAGISSLQAKIDDDSIEILLIRRPDMNEEDIAKMKKSKPKNLNVGQLYEAKYNGKVDLKQFQTPGCKNILQRVKVVFSEEMPEDGVKINAENCYVYIEISSSEALSPIVDEIKPTVSQIAPEFDPPEHKKSASSIEKLKLQICRSIKAISQQYTLFFAKDKDHTSEDRRHINLNSISTLRLNQLNKKKEVFLNQFINSGKFNILKERISKSIKSVVIDKFRKQKNTQKINIEDVNRTLSELYLFFQEQFTKTIDQFLETDNSSVHEDIVLGYQNSKQLRKNIIAPIVNQNENDRQLRIASEYQILHMQDKAEQNYLNLLLLNENNIQSKQNYAKFCLKRKNFDEAFILYEQIAEESGQSEHNLIKAVLLINRRRYREALQTLTTLIESQTASVPDKILYNQLLSFIYQIQGNIKESEKYLAIAQRYYKIKQNPNLKFNPPINPYEQIKPKVPKPERYISQLTHRQSQEIRLTLINFLSSLNLYDLVGIFSQKIEQSDRKSILQIEVCIFSQDYETAIQKINALLKKSDNIRNIDLLMMKADTCYIADKMFESEEVFLSILQLKPPHQKALKIYLKLGYTYLHRKSWEDAKTVFDKACQIKYNCSAAWLGKGIASLNLKNYHQSQQALNLSKIYNPLTSETDQYQALINKYFTETCNASNNESQQLMA